MSIQISIVVIHRGWVVVGHDKGYTKDGDLRLENAAVIRRWGTTKGLGELALEGPQPSTVLDKSPPMNIPKGAIINRIECVTPKKWKVLG